MPQENNDHLLNPHEVIYLDNEHELLFSKRNGWVELFHVNGLEFFYILS